MFRLVAATLPCLSVVVAAGLHPLFQPQAFLQLPAIPDVLQQNNLSPPQGVHSLARLDNEKENQAGAETKAPTTSTLGLAVMVMTTDEPPKTKKPKPTTLPKTTPDPSAVTDAPSTTTTISNTIVPVSGVCAEAKSCGECTALPECGWCALEGRCVEGNKLSPAHEQCDAYEFSGCSREACSGRYSCKECLQDPQCGWCGSTAKCVKGEHAGPLFSGDCPVGVKHWPIDWMHSSSELKCGTHLGLHDGTLWSSLKKLMDSSQARVAKLEGAVATPITYAPTEPPTTPPPAATAFPTTLVAVWPPTTTTTTTTKKKTTPTTTTMFTTTPYIPPKKSKDAPETVVDVSVCQNCKPPGEEGGEGGGGNETEPEEEAPPPPEFLQRFFWTKKLRLMPKKLKKQNPPCCFLHPECCQARL